MKTTPALIASLTAAITWSGVAIAQDGKTEKCFGMVKASQNDCQTATSSCAGTSKKDSQADAWIAAPAGVCAKIVGGSTSLKKG